MNNCSALQLLPLIAEAGVYAVADPLHQHCPTGRITPIPSAAARARVPEMRATDQRRLRPGLHDGSLVLARRRRHADVAHISLHVGQLTSREGDSLLLRGDHHQRQAQMIKISIATAFASLRCRSRFLLHDRPIKRIHLRARRLAVIPHASSLPKRRRRHDAVTAGRPAHVGPASYTRQPPYGDSGPSSTIFVDRRVRARYGVLHRAAFGRGGDVESRSGMPTRLLNYQRRGLARQRAVDLSGLMIY